MPTPRSRRGIATLRAALAEALLLAVLVGCAGAASPSPTGPAGPSGSAPASPVAGVIIGIDSSGLNGVHAFSLRTSTGRILRFTLGNLDNPTMFPPGHLAEHQLTGLPVLAFFTVDGPNLVVFHLEDAPVPSPS
jgi:hypothetical protein